MRRPGAERLIAAWRTNDRATRYLVEHLPVAVWSSQVPGIPRLTVGMIAARNVSTVLRQVSVAFREQPASP
jgi:hypothetical protein